ncbi:GNAT family N-acetyltransferase [bacterium]|nr:GNAT family N-acetyltransferase [bacterium]
MTIRKAKINELDKIMNMYASCVDGMQKANIDQWDSTYPNRKIISEDIRNKSFYIFLINDKIIGGINIDKIQDKTYLDVEWKDKDKKFLVVHRLAVRQEYWKKGIGNKLMIFAESLVKEKKLNSIRLDTYSSNPIAINFYLNLGYIKKAEIFLKPNKNEYYCFEKLI